MIPQSPKPQAKTAHVMTSLFGSPRDLLGLPLIAMHVVMAMRLCVICARTGQDPATALEQRFHSALAARRFRVLVMSIDQAWPDAFLINRPCCALLTPDEVMIADLAATAAYGDRAAFDTVSRDMLSGEVRDQLHIRFSAFMRALNAAGKG